MGIEDFRTFLEKNAPLSYGVVPLTSLSGKRIAFDLDNMIYAMSFVATRQVVGQTNLADQEPDPLQIQRLTLDRILERLIIFLSYNIQVVCCCDTRPNPLKENVKIKRRAYQEKKNNEYLEAKKALYQCDPLFRNGELTARFAKAFQANFHPSFEFMSHIRNFLRSLGFPVLMAGEILGAITGDAEGLAACLCLNMLCFATVTTDSDFHAYGGNLAILDISSRQISILEEGKTVYQTMHYATIRCLEAILQQSGLSFSAFRDACIMLGTDYNIRIPQVGPAKIIQLIRKYGSIPALAVEKDIRPYNYNEVLPIFSSSLIRLTSPVSLDFNKEKFQESGQDILENEQLTKYIRIINQLPLFQGSEKRNLPIEKIEEPSLSGLEL